MRIADFDHLVLTTADPESCRRFYCGALGMEYRERDGRGAFYFGACKINIHARPAEFLPAAERPLPGSLDFCLITADDIETVKAELIARGVPIVAGVVGRNGARGPMRSVYVRDPDGNLVEIAQYAHRQGGRR